MIPSPCIGRCRIAAGSRLCVGCARSGAEVAAWRDADPADRARVWADLPRRRAEADISLYRHGWSVRETFAYVLSSLTTAGGAWMIGTQGASVRVVGGQIDLGAIDDLHATITATSGPVAVRFTLDDRVRVLGMSSLGSGRERIILAVARNRDLPEPATALIPLGPDDSAIRPEDRTGRLFDLGLGRTGVRVGLRTHDDDLGAECECRAGSGWAEALAGLGARLDANRATVWVIEAPLVRVEVPTAVARCQGQPWCLDAASLTLDRATPPELDLPPTFVPCATFDPTSPPETPSGGARWLRRLIGRP